MESTSPLLKNTVRVKSRFSPRRSKIWRIKTEAGHVGRYHDNENCDFCRWLIEIKRVSGCLICNQTMPWKVYLAHFNENHSDEA